MSGAPGWFARNLSVMPEQGTTVVDGGRAVRWLRWGDPAAPMLLLLHGGGAHARWWSPLAPFLTGDEQRPWCVVAPDLAGMGDSDWRSDGYRTEDWATDLLRVANDAGVVPDGTDPTRAGVPASMAAPHRTGVPVGTAAPAPAPAPVVLGHSMGATVATVAATLHPESVRAVVLCDIGLPRPGRALAGGRAGRHFQNRITYPSAAEALSRFKLTPRQTCQNDWYVEHIARTSLRPVGAGGPGDPTRPPAGEEVAWAWKFDWRVFARTVDRPFGEHLAELGAGPVPVACLYGEDSRVAPAELVARVGARLGPVPTVLVPDARHHLMVDQPIAFVTAVRALLDRLVG